MRSCPKDPELGPLNRLYYWMDDSSVSWYDFLRSIWHSAQRKNVSLSWSFISHVF